MKRSLLALAATLAPCAEAAEPAAKKLYGVSGIPTQFGIGRNGEVAAVCVGDGDTRREDERKRRGVSVPGEK